MELKTASLAFSALSQPSRLAILRALVMAGTNGRTPGALSAELDIPPSTLSFHLKELQQAGLVQGSKNGRSITYMADYGGLRGLINYLLADCCQGDPRLCGPYVIRN
jgi:DNA-binding transcriptional ArsR family regulator